LHSKDVLRGWIRQNEPHHVVPGIVQLVSSYYMDSEAGIFQVGYKLYRVFQKAAKLTFSKEMAILLIASWLEPKCLRSGLDAVDAEACCDELIRLGYFKATLLDHESEEGFEANPLKTMYRIPMDKLLEFSYVRK